MKRSSHWLMVFIFLFLGISPADAQAAPAGKAWEPGFYTGWVSFSARIDSNMSINSQGSSMEGFVIERYEGNGQLMVKVDDQGAGGASIVLPTEINLLDYGKMTFPNGTCTFSSSIVAQTNYVHLRGASSAMGDAFQVPVNLVSGMWLKSTHAASFGGLQGCDQAGSKNLGAMKIAIKATTSQINAMQFKTNYNTASSIGGTCTIPGWVKTTPIKGGQGVRSLPKCNWRVFKAGQPNRQKGWK